MIKWKNRSAQMIRLKPAIFRAFSVALVATTLSACALLGGGNKEGSATIYAPDVRVAADPAWPTVAWSLAIAPPSAARMLDSTRIAVRPVPGELQVYHGARWSQPATSMLEDAVLRALEDSGKIRSVARTSDGIRADRKLLLDVRRFEADYAGNATPSTVIEVNAKLLGVLDQKVIATRTFVQTQPAADAQVAQVAAAFDRSLEAITRDIAGWVLTAQ